MLYRDVLSDLEHFGFVILPAIFSHREMASIIGQLSAALQMRADDSVLRSRGQVYGSRNLLETFPECGSLINRSPLREFTTTVLGSQGGMVRVLLFDKPPDRTWSLPWHKDRTIAVQRNDLPSDLFGKPTFKAGVPHVEAPEEVLEKMLTIRIHLDAMTAANGPLFVIPGSHRAGGEHNLPVELHAEVGDVLAMRPLLSHSSTVSRPDTTSHRRVIHIECAASRTLPDGYQWHSFVPFE